MGVAFTHMITDQGDTGTSIVTGSVAFQNNRLYLVSVNLIESGGTPRTVTGISGGGITWVNVVQSAWNNSLRIEGWRGRVTSGASTGTLTITTDGAVTNSAVGVEESDGTEDTTGTNGSGAIGVTTTSATGNATSLTLSLASFASSSHTTFSAFAHTAAESTTETATQLFDTNGLSNMALMAQYQVTQNLAPSASWTTNTFRGGAAMEIKSPTAGGTAILDPMGMTGFFGA